MGDQNKNQTLNQFENSDRSLRRLILQIPASILILRGKNHLVEMVNLRSIEMWDIPEQEILNKPLQEVIPGLKTKKVTDILEAVYKKGQALSATELEIQIQRHGKEEKMYVNMSFEPFYDAAGEIESIVTIGIEVTDQVLVRRKLAAREQEGEKRFRLLADSMSQKIWTAGPEGNVNYYNRAFFDYSGLKLQELNNKGWIQIMHPDELEGNSKTWIESIITGKDFLLEHRFRRHDGEYRWQLSRAVPQKDEAGNIKMWVGTSTDVQEQKNFTEELEKQVKKRTDEIFHLNKSLKKSEELYHQMVEEIQDYAILYLNRDGIVQNWNKGAEKIKGYRPEEIIGKSFFNFYTAEDKAKNLPQQLLQIAEKTGRARQEGWRVKKDGTYFWAAVVITAVHNDKNEVIGFSKVTHDLTDKKAAEDQLKKSEERYHLMVEEVEDYAILYLDREGIVENWNAGAEKIKGYKAQEIIGKSFSNFYTAADKANNLPQQLLQLAETTGRARQEGWRVKKDGNLFWASVVITAVHNENREVIGFSKVTHDLTDKKRAEDELYHNNLLVQRKNRDLEEMNKELQAFAFISSHDLQEPLRKIQTFVSRLAETEKNNFSDRGKDLFNRMKNSAQRMQALIDDLLAYSRIQAPVRNFENVNIRSLIGEVIDDLKEEIEQKNAVIEIEGTCEVNIIAFQFRQVIYNLVSNSLKFSIQGKKLRIDIKIERAMGDQLNNQTLEKNVAYCHIGFSDNGIGFDARYSEKIFELFQRLHGRDEFQGTGIGLAIVKRIVGNHGGIITAKGEVGKGAAFDIYLPVHGK